MNTVIYREWPTFHDLLVAYKSCRFQKPSTNSQIRFELRLAENLEKLHRSIHSGEYRPAPAKCFVITKPKPREIFAADFSDRIVHHTVVSKLEPILERKFIHSSFACRKGKGLHGAIKYTQEQVRSISRGGIHPVFVLQVDIEKFFVSIDRGILCSLLLKHARHPRLQVLINAIYSHDARIGAKKVGDQSLFAFIPKGKSWLDQDQSEGIPIGNLTSQFGANVYLTELDHLIQRNLKPAAYLRYMDDLLLLDRDPAKLEKMIDPIDNWLRTARKQRLNPNKTILSDLRNGIRYLGYELRQTEIPAQPLQIFPEPLKKWGFVKDLRLLENQVTQATEKPHRLAPHLHRSELKLNLASINSKAGTLVHANTYRLRKKALEKFVVNSGDMKGIPKEFGDSWSPFAIKRGYRAIRLK